MSLARPVLARASGLAVLVLTVVAAPASAQSRWYLAEGASNSFFDEEILIGNPNATPADVRITFLLPGGSPIEHSLQLPATARATVRVNAVPGLGSAGAVSAVVECTNALDIVVERSMYWAGGQRYSGHNSNGLTETATEWLLAEGATGFFDVFILLANPDPTQTADVGLTFLRSDGTTVDRDRMLPPNSRTNLWVNAEVPELANQAFSTTVRSRNAVPIAVERAMYFGPAWKGGHGSVGITQPATTWYFAEGFTGPGPPGPLQFDTFLLLANPGSTTAAAQVVFFTDEGVEVERSYTLPSTSRTNVWVDLVPGLENAAFSVRITADQPIVAERAMYWGVGAWDDAHNTPGLTAESTRWAFAEGAEDGLDATGTLFDTYFLVANGHPMPLELRATFYREDGTGIVRSFTVPAGSRFNVFTGLYPELSNQRFAAFLESTNGLPFTAERAVYWGGFVGGHATRGTPWSGAIATPPAPPAPTVSSVTPLSGPTGGGTLVTISGDNFAQGATVTLGGSPLTGVSVLNKSTIVGVTSPHAAGLVEATVQSAGATGTLPGAYTYAPSPTITGVTPNRGQTPGGTGITISGANFAAGATVTIGGTPATNVVLVNGSTITATTPAHAAGTVTVAVTSEGVQTTLPGSFTYVQIPTNVLAFGDSITFGISSTLVSFFTMSMTTSTTIVGYPPRLRTLLEQKYPGRSITVTNAGRPGECAAITCGGHPTSGKNRLPTELTSAQNYVILLEGVNDLNAGLATSAIRDALRTMVQTAKAGGKTVVISTLLPVRPVAGAPIANCGAAYTPMYCRADLNRIKQMNARIVPMATEEGAVLIDMYQQFGGDTPDGTLLSPDGLHPNDAGYQRMAQAFFDRLMVLVGS